MKSLSWISLFLVLSSGMAFALPRFRCESLFSTPKLEFEIGEWGVQANSIAITGEKDYPLSEVLKGLEIDQQWIKQQWIKQQALGRKKVLSIAEGISKLLPELVANGADAYATDLWYFQIKSKQSNLAPLHNFERQWRDRLFP